MPRKFGVYRAPRLAAIFGSQFVGRQYLLGRDSVLACSLQAESGNAAGSPADGERTSDEYLKAECGFRTLLTMTRYRMSNLDASTIVPVLYSAPTVLTCAAGYRADSG